MKKIFFISIFCALAFVSCSEDNGTAPDGEKTVSVFVEGAKIHGANGIYFGPDGYLYVASVFGRDISAIDVETGEIVKSYGPADQVDGPDDVVFGPDGSMYWTDLFSGYVGRRYPDGTIKKQFVNPGTNPITITEDGKRLFTACDFVGDGFYELDPDLEESPRQVLPQLGWMNAFDVGPEGWVWGPVLAMGKICKVNPDDATVVPIECDLHYACAVKFGPDGMIYTAEGAAGNVVKVDPTTFEKEIIATLPVIGQDNVAVRDDGNIYVSNFGDGSIAEVKPDGSYRFICEPGICAFGGLAVLENSPVGDKLFVANAWTLANFDLTSKAYTYYPTWWYMSPDSMTTCHTVSVWGDKLVLSSISDLIPRVQVWDPVMNRVENDLSYPPDFASLPTNAVAFGAEIAIAEIFKDGSGGQIVLANKNDFGDREQVTGAVGIPAGMAVIDNDLYVCDYLLGKVFKVIDDGQKLAQPETVADNLIKPEGLAADNDGNLIVVESGTGKVVKIDLSIENEISIVAEGLKLDIPANAGGAPFWLFNDCAVDSEGKIYVSGDIENVIYVIQ